MTIIQAYRRKYPITQIAAGVPVEFKLNALGHAVAAVTEPEVIDWLLNEPTAFRVYAEDANEGASAVLTATPSGSSSTPDGDEPPPPADDEHPFVLRDGDNVLDLRPLTDVQLREFAKANGIAIHHNAKGDTIRKHIVQAILGEPGKPANDEQAGDQKPQE